MSDFKTLSKDGKMKAFAFFKICPLALPIWLFLFMAHPQTVMASIACFYHDTFCGSSDTFCGSGEGQGEDEGGSNWAVCGEFLGGYRVDKITTKAKRFDDFLGIRVNHNLEFKGLDIWEVGFKARVIYSDSWFLEGHAIAGNICEGRYIENTNPNCGSCPSIRTQSHVKNGDTHDYSIGFGYLFSCFECKLGPKIGWSWDDHFIRLGNAHTDFLCDSSCSSSSSCPDELLSDLSYKDCWNGFWIGLEGSCEWRGLQFELSYTYHLPHWNNSWKLRGIDLYTGSNGRKGDSNNGFGNVVSFDMHYPFCDNFSVGFGVNYEYWKVNEGSDHISHDDCICHYYSSSSCDVDGRNKITQATWQSLSVHVNLGVCF